MLRSSWRGFCLCFVDKTSGSWSHLSSKETGKCIVDLYQGFVIHPSCWGSCFSDSVFRHGQIMSISPGSAGKHTHKRPLFSIVCESGLLFKRCYVVRTLCITGGIISEPSPTKKKKQQRGGRGRGREKALGNKRVKSFQAQY